MPSIIDKHITKNALEMEEHNSALLNSRRTHTTTLLHFEAWDALGCIKIHIVQSNPAHQLPWASLYIWLLNWNPVETVRGWEKALNFPYWAWWHRKWLILPRPLGLGYWKSQLPGLALALPTSMVQSNAPCFLKGLILTWLRLSSKFQLILFFCAVILSS